jgi:hypothetical protein
MHVFSSKARLEYHLNTVHRQVGPASVLRGYFTMENGSELVPPAAAPPDLSHNLKW